jgi:FKBP-type peptidyl-prolyl cis-trans isomerase (trigger factor)
MSMESKVISIYDYHNIDLSPYAKEFVVNERAIQDEISNIQNKGSKWEAGSTVCKSDIVVCSLKSENPKFNKEKIKIVAGSGMFNSELENKLVGIAKGENKSITINDEPVCVEINDIMHRVVAPFDDETAASLGIEGVKTTADFHDHLSNQQKKEFIEKIEYPAIQFAVNEMLTKSDVVVKKQEWKAAIDMELSKYKALCSLEGLVLEEMKDKDFDGKIPVKSYYELMAMVQLNNWDTVSEYLIGKAYAERKGYCPNEEDYEKYIKEYMEFWHNTDEEARKITTYEHFIFFSYTGCFYNEISEYVKKNILK